MILGDNVATAFVPLRSILNETTVQPAHLSQKFLIVLTLNGQDSASALEEANHVLWKNSLIDSHVLNQDATHSWILHTFLPYQNGCFTPSQLRLESFTISNFSEPMSLSKSQVYPEKLKNFNGCPIYISSTTFYPFIYINKTIDGRHYYAGYDPLVMDEISKDLNCTMVYILPEMKNGKIVKNRPWKESFELVFIY